MNRSKLKLITIFFLMLILQSGSPVFSQTGIDLDPAKWANALSKKDLSSYDSLTSLVVKLQKADSLQAFQFLDKLSEKGRSKGDHFQALFNCLKASVIFNKCYYKFYQNRPTSVNIDWVKQQLILLTGQKMICWWHM